MSESNPLSVQKPTNLASIEAILFVAMEPISPAIISETLQIPATEVEKELDHLQQSYQGRGIRLQWHAGKVQLTSAAETGEVVEKFLGLETTSHLSRAALETLAIIAYRQPVTRPSLESVRGVNSDGVLRSLLNKGLIQEIGRSEGPGRPILYGTTPDFLQYFGLTSLGELPPLTPVESLFDKTTIGG